MEKVILYMVLFAGYILYQVFKASNKKAQQQKAKGTKNPRKNVTAKQSEGQVFKELGLEDLFKQIQDAQQKNAPASQKVEFPGLRQKTAPPRPPKPAERDKSVAEVKAEMKAKALERKKKQEQLFLNREIESARKGHFSEERLVREFEARHKIGKEVEHHLHHYVDDSEYDDARKQYAEADTEFEKQEKKVREEERRAYQEKTKRKKSYHPLAHIVRDKNKIRQAWLMKEVFDRRY